MHSYQCQVCQTHTDAVLAVKAHKKTSERELLCAVLNLNAIGEVKALQTSSHGTVAEVSKANKTACTDE